MTVFVARVEKAKHLHQYKNLERSLLYSLRKHSTYRLLAIEFGETTLQNTA